VLVLQSRDIHYVAMYFNGIAARLKRCAASPVCVVLLASNVDYVTLYMGIYVKSGSKSQRL